MSEVELFATAIFMCGCAGVVMGLSARANTRYIIGLTENLGILMAAAMCTSFLYWIAWTSRVGSFGGAEAGFATIITVAFGMLADKLHIHKDVGKWTLLNPKKTAWTIMLLTATIVLSYHTYPKWIV